MGTAAGPEGRLEMSAGQRQAGKRGAPCICTPADCWQQQLHHTLAPSSNTPLAARGELHAIGIRGLGLRRAGQLGRRLRCCAARGGGSPVTEATCAAWSAAAAAAAQPAAESAAATAAATWRGAAGCAASLRRRRRRRRRRRVGAQAGHRLLPCGWLDTSRPW